MSLIVNVQLESGHFKIDDAGSIYRKTDKREIEIGKVRNRDSIEFLSYLEFTSLELAELADIIEHWSDTKHG